MKSITYTIAILLSGLLACDVQNDEGEEPTPSDKVSNVTTVINDEIKGDPAVIYINGSTETMVAFSRNVNSATHTFFKDTTVSSNTSFIDDQGNKWNIFGEGISSGNRNQKLKPLNYIYGYWFVFPAFYDSVQIYNDKLYTFPKESPDNEDWLVPTKALVSTGPRDLFPSLDDPSYVKATDFIKNNLGDNNGAGINDLATVIKIKDNILIYPHSILNYHEVVNDEVEGQSFTLSFCPLTQTSQVWKRSPNDLTTLGVSGLLYNNNLILYDRKTSSYWSQILQSSISGDYKGKEVEYINYAEMKLKDALELRGNKMALSTNTGYSRNYGVDFYNDYKSDKYAIYHPLLRTNDHFNQKQKVLGIVENENYIKIYAYE